jgi:hypothetical protein
MDTREKPYKFVVRFPLRLRDQIADAPKYYRRSMNSEIVSRLEQSFAGLPTAVNDDHGALLHGHFDTFLHKTLTADEEQLIRSCRALSEDKRKALRDLLA